MSARLTSAMLVSAMLRRIEATGGHGMVLARGDATAGAILVALSDRGVAGPLLERTLAPGGYMLAATGPEPSADPGEQAAYVARRQARDPDLWIVELDGAEAATIAHETIG